ncbi:MAG: flagellar basal body P-ring formation protein FlgA [Gammaproteobacteria bacterium]|nr:flagellar basal body P-ring formation protein FlgA [Gammaproteobacteria bacterium]
MPIRLINFVLCCFFLLPPAWGSPFQSHESIRAAARSHALDIHAGVDHTLELRVSDLDKRLRLGKCDTPLETFSSDSTRLRSKLTVGVRCTDQQPWSIYVPVNVKLFKKVLVATRSLSRGAVLSSADIKLKQMDITRLRRGYLEQPRQVVGKALKRSIRPDSILTPNLLSFSEVISRGAQVTILGQIGGISVRMEGKALGNGTTGERILVRNISSNRRIEATVMAPGIVKVAL